MASCASFPVQLQGSRCPRLAQLGLSPAPPRAHPFPVAGSSACSLQRQTWFLSASSVSSRTVGPANSLHHHPQTSSFPLRVTAAQGTARPLSQPCCPCAAFAQWVLLPGSSWHPPHSNELLCGAEIHFQDPSRLHGWFLLLSPARRHRLLPKSFTFCLISHSSSIAEYRLLAWLPALLPLHRCEGAA